MQNGLIDNSQDAVDMGKVNAMKTEIKMQIAKTMLINDRDANIKQIIERLEKQEIIMDSNMETGQVKTQPDGYVYEIKQNEEKNWEVIYIGMGEIDKVELIGEIEIGSTADLEKWTNQDILLEITWPENAEYYKRQVSIDGGKTWKEYTGTIAIEENSEIIAKVEDYAGNEMKKATMEISKIDKEKPTVGVSPNGGMGYVMPIDANGTTGKAKIKTKLTATDKGGSELKILQYAWNQSAETEPTSWTDFTNGQEVEKSDVSTAGTWYLWTNVIDVAGNRATEIQTSEGFVVSANTESEYIIKLTPDYTDWTANDITVTATYGTKLTPISLSCTGTSGTDYGVNGTTSVAVKTNNQTVTAIAVDKAGNVVTATLTVTKIDKNVPIVTANAESITITEGDVNDPKGYFTYSENGGASITSVECTDVSNNNAVIENTNTLAIGTHTIRCTVTKETGKSDYAEITIVVERKIWVATDGSWNEEDGVNNPLLLEGMTAVYWSKDGGVTASTTEEGATPIYSKVGGKSTGADNSAFNWENWYDYVAGDNATDTKTSRWANAVTDDGSYWVWIPRFKYIISDAPTAAGANNAGKIDVKFIGVEEKSGATVNNATYTTYKNGDGEFITIDQNNYIVHPAFEDGSSDSAKAQGHSDFVEYNNGEWDSELAGFWMAKYEMSAENASGTAIQPGNVPISDTVKLVSKPGVSSWRNITSGNSYKNSYNYNRINESHLIKMSEWGAVAYLTHSQYGRNKNEVTINTSYTTAYVGELGSTTGNIYGVYDMNGGALERVAAWISVSTSSVLTSYGSVTIDGYSFGTSGGVSTKYATSYLNNTATEAGVLAKTVCKIGDGVKEMYISGYYGWFYDYADFANVSDPFFQRGGYPEFRYMFWSIRI